MNVDLTTDQKQAIDRGEAVPLALDETECVLLRKDVYERVRRAVDGEEFAPEEAYPAVAGLGSGGQPARC